MRRLTLPELLAVTDTSVVALKSLRRRHHVALAFGRSDAYESLSYLELDAVALMIAETLSQSYTRTVAAQITRIHCDVWGRVVAEAEATPDEARQFCVIDYTDHEGKKAHLACGARTTDAEAIALELSMTPQAFGATAERVTCVSVTRLIQFIRKTAARHNVDLSRPFLPPPGDPRLDEIFRSYEDTRDRAIAAVKARKGRDELARYAGQMARATAELSIED